MMIVLWSLMPDGQWDDDCFVVLWSLMPDGQREMMVAGFFMIIDALWANQRIRLMKFPFFSP